MTDRERQFYKLGMEYAANIELAQVVNLPNGREVRKVDDMWEVQPPTDNYWEKFDDLLDAVRFGMVGYRQNKM